MFRAWLVATVCLTGCWRNADDVAAEYQAAYAAKHDAKGDIAATAEDAVADGEVIEIVGTSTLQMGRTLPRKMWSTPQRMQRARAM